MTFYVSKSARAFALAILVIVVGLTVLAPAFAQATHPSHNRGARVRPVFSQALPPMNGNRLTTEIVEVTYGPGDFSAPHSHPCPVVVYILSGAVRMQVKGQPEGIYKAGQTFYEAPNGIHQVSANASKKQPAKFLAYFVCDHKTPLTVPVPNAKGDAAESKGAESHP